MNSAFDMLGSVIPGRESWRFKIRVLRLWSVSSFMKPHQVHSLEMVLIDEKGSKIRASVRRQLLYMFSSKIAEGNVYKMSFFTVFPESGLFRSTQHPYKLVFEMKTKVQMCESNLISRYGLSLSSIGDICAYGPDHDFLVDVVALVTGISPEREYVRDGKVTQMIVVELTDKSGKCECALFGEYVPQLQGMFLNCGDGLPTVVVQFAKIKMFGGKISIQNVMSATKIYVNPPIPEVVSFKQLMATKGIDSGVPIPAIVESVKPTSEEEFLGKYPKTSIAHLLELAEDGTYVVGVVVAGLVDDEEWWYPSCKCHRSLSHDSGAYYCRRCDKHVFKMVPRFRVKLRVDDGTAEGVFVVFDGDMNALIGKHCPELVASLKTESAGYIPPELELLKGKRFLFKVEKVSHFRFMHDHSFKVKRICSDVAIMESFDGSLVKENGGSDDGVELDVEYVGNSQVEEFVGNLIVSPSAVKDGNEIDVSSGHMVSEIVNLDDDSDRGFDIFVPARIGIDCSKVLSAKRNLSSAFAECADDDNEASTSKFRKLNEE